MSTAGTRPWWLPAVLLTVMGVFAVCLMNALAWIERPFPGFLLLENGIVVSIGRAEWSHTGHRTLSFARVLAVDGHPVAGGREVHAYVNRAGIGKSITYTFRQGTDIFRLAMRVRSFDRADFLALFVPLLGVGLLMVVISGAVVAMRPRAPEARALFVLCIAIGLILMTGPDEYGPYWLTGLFFPSLCAITPASVQLALAYPQRSSLLHRRPVFHAALYTPFLALGAALISSIPEPSLFLPLLYCVYFFMANGALVLVGALAVGLIDGVRPREPVLLALAGMLGSSTIAAAIVATYPLLKQPISPTWAFGPLLLLPLLEGWAFVRFPTPAAPASELMP